MAFFRRKQTEAIDLTALPQHIAIIMDGNGRWAKRRGMPRKYGHSQGAKVFRRIATYCKELGIKHFTAYAFSTENWKRPQDEIDSIMKLLDEYLDTAEKEFEQDEIRLTFLGDRTRLSEELQAKMNDIERRSSRFDNYCNIAINYGGRDEILHAVNSYLAEHPGADHMTESDLSAHLYTAGQPDPDLIIRPSGEQRLSNFLLWQAAYEEFYYSDILWPDFTERDLDRAILAYQQRNRRFGGV